MLEKRIINAESQFLSGPNSRGKEFLFLVKVIVQFFRGFRKLHFVGPCVTVFGSARFNEVNPYYQQARDIGYQLSQMGFAVMTGGGPGIMEAANRGAHDAGGLSIGCTIKLPKEQVNNPFMTKIVHFDYFFIRKVLLTKYSYAFVVMPGGFGTLDELFETLTLIQTGILHNFPVVIVGKTFYKDIMEMVLKMIEEKTISPTDEKLILFTDSTEEAMNHIRSFIHQNYKIKYKASWILGER
ncbi:MAG: TIGR00730 family Rossman fold protein [Saprospiraceae bacterium]|nr:TIGR00730 family Rossman fold protein [Saprospiraceae bacterium]